MISYEGKPYRIESDQYPGWDGGGGVYVVLFTMENDDGMKFEGVGDESHIWMGMMCVYVPEHLLDGRTEEEALAEETEKRRRPLFGARPYAEIYGDGAPGVNEFVVIHEQKFPLLPPGAIS